MMSLEIQPSNGIFNTILVNIKGTLCVPFFIFAQPKYNSCNEKKSCSF